MEYVLTTSNLCKNYKQFKALNNFSMKVPKGAIYGFVGKNGTGKTTLIRLICGLQTATSGSYSLYGVENTSNRIEKMQKRMGAVVETPSIYLDMTAEENMREQYYMLELLSFDDIPQILKLVGLESTGNKKAKDFSLGMRQRLGIAIALAGKPDLLVLDEPTNGLDPQGIVEIRELILKLNREKRITVLISSHILDELAKLATHYGFIEKGSMLKEILSNLLLCGMVGMMIVSIIALSKLSQPEFILQSTIEEETVLETVKNPLYLNGAGRVIYQNLLDFLPAGQSVQIFNQEELHIGRMAAYSLGIIGLTNIVGVRIFKQKDIK